MTTALTDPASEPAAAWSGDDATWSSDETGSHAVDRELQRQLVRAALFETRTAPRIGRFAVADRLGAGASSVVYSAWDDLLARWVAVKLFVAGSAATRDQVQREARALAQLSHRNVVAVYDVGEWNGHAFIAMELIAGTTLARWQADRKRSTAALLDAYLQAGRGLAAAHQAGLVHRDFKPTNVMVAGDGRVVVTDFGLVGGVSRDPGAAPGEPGSASTTRAPIGTPAYVAPEQRLGAAPHPSADIYSFSLALCEALIGWHPMRDPDAWSRALARRVPRRIHRAICTGLSRQPAARGDAMAALLDALSPPRRRGWRSAAIAAAGLVAATATGLRYRGHAPTPEPAAPPVFAAPSLRALVRQIDAFVGAPPREDDRPAAAALRSLLLAPLPTELRCDWPAPLAGLALGGDHAIGVDEQGRVHACALGDGAISLVAGDAQCAVPGPDGTIGVVDRALRIHVLRATATGWQAVATADSAIPVPHNTSPRYCPIVVVRERGGATRVGLNYELIGVQRAGRIEVIADRGELRVIDRAGPELASHALPDPRITPQIDITGDGSRALVVPMHGPVLWWQAGTGVWREERVHFDTPTLTRARLSPSGRRALLVNQLGGLEVRTLGGGRTAWLTSDAITDAVFDGEDAVIASDTSGRLWRWDLATARSGVVAIYRRAVWSVASNPEVVASGSEDGTVTVVDRRTGAARLVLHPASEIYKVMLDGDYLITGGNDGLRRWNWRSGAPVPLADGRGLRIWDFELATAGDGGRIYLAGALAHCAIFAWTASERTAIYQTARSRTRVSDVAVSADGRTAAEVDAYGNLVVLDVATRRVTLEVPAHTGSGFRVAFDPATATIVTAGEDGYLRSWTPPALAPRQVIPIGDNRSAVYGLDVHVGRAVTASFDGSVTLIDLASGQIVRRYHGHNSAVRTVRFSPDGRWFVTGDNDGRVCLWQVDDDQCHTWLDGHRAAVLDAEFAGDGTIFTTSNDGTVRSWRPTYDQPVEALHAELLRRRQAR